MTRPREVPLVLAAAAIVALHLVDVAAWLPLVFLALAVVGARLLPAGPRALLLAAVAPLVVVGGMLHLLHLRWDGFARTDATGLALFAAAGLLAVAAILAVLERRSLPPLRRALRAVATLALVTLTAVFFVVPVSAAMWLAGKPRQPLSPGTFPLPHADVTLRAADGTRLAGWWVPSRNGAAVVLVHGGGGDRNGVRRQALLLAQHGYGVLLYDERGRGESGGTTQSMGWNWVQDVRAAVDYASEQHRVRAVGALGLSTGAEVVVTAAAHDSRIRAVVAEGLINRDLADSEHQKTSDNITGIPYWWVTFQALRVETGAHPPEPLTEDLRRIAPRPVLIIAAAKNPPERTAAPAYARAAGPTASLWLARADHTRALETMPRRYERRVVGLFDRALLRGRAAAYAACSSAASSSRASSRIFSISASERPAR